MTLRHARIGLAIAAGFMAVTIANPAPAMAQDAMAAERQEMASQVGEALRNLSERLGLTEDQKGQIHSILEETIQERNETIDKLREIDDARIAEMREVGAEYEGRLEQTRTELRDVLTDEQREILGQWIEEQRGQVFEIVPADGN